LVSEMATSAMTLSLSCLADAEVAYRLFRKTLVSTAHPSATRLEI
jgi:hypothetical protein